MNWTINYTETAKKALKKLDRQIAKQIIKYIDSVSSNPRGKGKALSGTLGYLWRYRVEDYRIICEIQDEKLTVLVVKIGHRRAVYRQYN